MPTKIIEVVQRVAVHYEHTCALCAHNWTSTAVPQSCPRCRSRKWPNGRRKQRTPAPKLQG